MLAIVALFVFGPDRLPEVARQAGRMLTQARAMLTNARAQVADELGPEFADLDLSDLNPRALVQKHLLDDLEDDDAKPHGRVIARSRPGEPAPFDADAT